MLSGIAVFSRRKQTQTRTMKLSGLRKALVLIAAILISLNCLADKKPEANDQILNLVKKYENTKGVECMSIVKGEGLELIKMMLKKEFGRKFMKGVTSIIIIEYSDASEDISKAIRGELDVFMTSLKEIDVTKEMDLEGCDYVRCFAKEMDSSHISDFVLVMEGEGSKMLMYMGGEIILE